MGSDQKHGTSTNLSVSNAQHTEVERKSVLSGLAPEEQEYGFASAEQHHEGVWFQGYGLEPFRVGVLSSELYVVLRCTYLGSDRQLIGISNWAIFRDHLRSVARATGLTGYLDGSISTPASTVITSMSSDRTTGVSAPPVSTVINSRTPSIEEWELRDGRLAGIIFQNIQDPRSLGVTEFMTAHNMWTRLTSKFDTSSAAAQALAKERIQQFRYLPGVPFE
ncbi:hypothetical protein F5050DRAFT_1710733, partial [Lentinula boryana]